MNVGNTRILSGAENESIKPGISNSGISTVTIQLQTASVKEEKYPQLPINPTCNMGELKVSILAKQQAKAEKLNQHTSGIDLLCNRIKKRMESDERELEKFLTELDLMRYYDNFWNQGLTNNDMLVNVTVEDLNSMYIPAGHQIKVEIAVSKMRERSGMNSVGIACGTDDLEDFQQRQVSSSPKRTNNYMDGGVTPGQNQQKKSS